MSYARFASQVYNYFDLYCVGESWEVPIKCFLGDEDEFSIVEEKECNGWEKVLLKILRLYAPTITFLQYDELCELYDYREYIYSDYYEPSQKVTYRTIKLEDVYNKLVEWNYL